MTTYKLFIDDERTPSTNDYVVMRSSQAALAHVEKHGMPAFISFDHDLGGDDTAMVFLRELVARLWDGCSPPPEYVVHSANPVGSQNIVAFMNSWKKSQQLD